MPALSLCIAVKALQVLEMTDGYERTDGHIQNLLTSKALNQTCRQCSKKIFTRFWWRRFLILEMLTKLPVFWHCGRLTTVNISHVQRKGLEFYATAEVYFGYTLTFLEERHYFEVVN